MTGCAAAEYLIGTMVLLCAVKYIRKIKTNSPALCQRIPTGNFPTKLVISINSGSHSKKWIKFVWFAQFDGLIKIARPAKNTWVSKHIINSIESTRKIILPI